METASIVVRAGLFLISLAALAGSAMELAVSTRLEEDLAGNLTFCRYFLCDESAVAKYAYRQQLERDGGSLKLAAEMLQQVVLRDPASAERWIDLGEVLSAAGSEKEARSCIARALELGSTSADVLMPAGNFYLLTGERREGIRYLSRTLALTPSFDAAIFSYFSAQHVEIEELLKSGVPEERRVAQAYLRYSVAQGQLSSAVPVWQWVERHGFADQDITIEYVNFLVAQRRYGEAAEAWASQAGFRVPGYRQTEFLYNGNFAREPIPGAVFDWKILPCDNVEIVRDTQAGATSLRLRFDGSANVDYRHISQKTVLLPGKYRFRARVRTENITTDEGLFFRIADGEAPKRLSLETEPLLGTSDWRMVESAFAVGQGTRIVELSVNRRPSLRFDNKINGTIWLEQLSVAPIGLLPARSPLTHGGRPSDRHWPQRLVSRRK
jgi:tetratricopeptide (TPR) repeat protein